MRVHDLQTPGGPLLSPDATHPPNATPVPAGTAAADGPEPPTFRVATLADAPAILEVVEAAFDHWPEFEIPVTPLEHLQWKMQSLEGIELAAAPDELPHTVGEQDGRIVSTALRVASVVQVNGEEWLTSSGTDQAVHPDYQSRGITKLQRAARRALPLVGDLGMGTQSQHVRLKNSRDRRPDAERAIWWLTGWALNFDLRAAIGTQLRSGAPFPKRLAALPGVVARHLRRSRPTTEVAGVTFAPIERFDERANQLWEAVRHSFDVVRVRRAAYLNWRYADPRSGRSEILGAFEGERLVGFAVFRPSGNQSALVDLLVEPGRTAVAEALANRGAERMRELGCRRVTAWLPPNHPLRDALSGAGFVESGEGARMSFHQLRGSDAPIDLDWFRRPDLRFHVMMGDHDFV